MFSTSTIIGISLIGFAIKLLMVKLSKFYVTKDNSGITIITEKETGKQFIQYKNGNVTKL